MQRLLEGKVQPSVPGEKALKEHQIQLLIKELGNNWQVVNDHELEKEFIFSNFEDALAYVNLVGTYSEEVNHHPEITFTWGRAKISIYTHDVGGLREEDFFWAARVEQIYQEYQYS